MSEETQDSPAVEEEASTLKDLLVRNQLWWTITAGFYALVSVAVVVFAGPLAWGVRSNFHGMDGGVTALYVGSVAGLGFGVAFLSMIARGSKHGKVLPYVIGVMGLAAAVNSIWIMPTWVLASLTPIGVVLVVLAVLSDRKVRRDRADLTGLSRKERRKRKRALEKEGPQKGDVPVSLGLLALGLSVGLLGSSIISTMTTLWGPDVPEELEWNGEVVVGEGGDVEVEIIAGYHTPASAILLTDIDGDLAELIEDGDLQLTIHQVAVSSEENMAVYPRVGELCAYDEAGVDGVFDYITNYNYTSLEDPERVGTNTLAANAGEDTFGESFTDCVYSGQYEYPATQAATQSQFLYEVQETMPQITVDGENVQPEDPDELTQLIRDALRE